MEGLKKIPYGLNCSLKINNIAAFIIVPNEFVMFWWIPQGMMTALLNSSEYLKVILWTADMERDNQSHERYFVIYSSAVMLDLL